MADDDESTLIIETWQNFSDTYAESWAWDVPPTERYPDGVRYPMQYGTTDGELIFRYDKFLDQPGTTFSIHGTSSKSRRKKKISA